ncbi:MAG: aminopeptidase-like protein [Halioglobus sp.]|jgi:aminopeptidase-like protein
MNGNTLHAELDKQQLGKELFDSITQLYPICRSITGNGVRKTLSHLNQIVPLTIHEVPSGTTVLDWTIPNEWNIRDAWVKNGQGQRVIDFQKSNLHVVNYSMPFRGRMSLKELRPHLFTLPDQPDWIPYRTSYYNESWGFCLSQNQLDALPEGDYEVCIDTSLESGHLSYGEILIPGESAEEVLVSCHLCHPSLANDNLSGVVVAAHMARHLQSQALRYSYRFLFIPGTIGAITWLARNEIQLSKIRYGLVLAGLGDAGPLTYKRSRRGDSMIDRAAVRALGEQGEHEVLDFSPYGYDERQYCAPGFNLPVGRLSRTPHGSFPEYHTSADNLDFVQPSQLASSILTCLRIFQTIEDNRCYLNLKPHGEPQLGKYGLYDPVGGVAISPEQQMAILWVLNLSDGEHSLLDIAERAGLTLDELTLAAIALTDKGLLREVT